MARALTLASNRSESGDRPRDPQVDRRSEEAHMYANGHARDSRDLERQETRSSLPSERCAPLLVWSASGKKQTHVCTALW